MPIKVLDDHTINKIAAGEVIERPYSIVKELLENSIDADSKNIEIHIDNGEEFKIIITDDGKGIHEEDLHLCIQRHATSKISNNDLSDTFLIFEINCLLFHRCLMLNNI